MQKYELEYAVLKKQVTYLVPSDGLRHARLEFLYAAHDEDNNLLYTGTSNRDPVVLPQNLDLACTGMYHAKQVFNIPTNTSWLRVGARDAVDARIGSLEILLPLRIE